jgi:serine/threonine protein kinase
MSPEALDGRRSVQTDIWSVGVNLYQFLMGTLPFPHKDPSVLFPAIIMREFAPLPYYTPQNLKNVIAKSLAKLPENRYKSSSEMREDLRRILRSVEVSNFLQSDLPPIQQFVPSEQIPPTQYVIPTVEPVETIQEYYSEQTFLPETETSVRPNSTSNSEQTKMLKRKDFVMFAPDKAKIPNQKGFVMNNAPDEDKRRKQKIAIVLTFVVLPLLAVVSNFFKC